MWGMDTGSSSQDGLFAEGLVERIETPDDGRMDANGGVKKRFKAFEPDAVMLVPPSLDEWLPQKGLMIAGDVDEHGHHPWPHSMGGAIERITRTWLTEWPDEIPTPGAIVWLANTEAGNRVGREVLAREAETN